MSGLPAAKSQLDPNEVRNPFWPFDNKKQWDLAYTITFPRPLGNQLLKRIAVEKYASWIKPGCGFQSVKDYKDRMTQLPTVGGEWKSTYVCRGPAAPSWAPLEIKYHIRDSLDVLRFIVGDVRVQNFMKWAPEKQWNNQGDRLYSELWSGDWWWRMQVCSIPNAFFDPRKH